MHKVPLIIKPAIIAGIGIFIILLAFVIPKNLIHKAKHQEQKTTKSDEKVYKQVIKELNAKPDNKISIVGTIHTGEEKTITFLMHDYSQISPDLHDLAAQKKQRKPTKGQISIRIKKIGSTDQLKNVYTGKYIPYSKTKDGYKYYYVIYEVKGYPNNPHGGYIHPQDMEEKGWDPAPQFIVYNKHAKANKQIVYSQSYYRREILKTAGFDAPLLTPNLNQPKWQIMANAWKLNYKPQIYFMYISPEGTSKLLLVEE